MTSFGSARLGVLFRQRAQVTDALRYARAKADRLTLEHNDLIRKAGQAAIDGARQRAQADKPAGRGRGGPAPGKRPTGYPGSCTKRRPK